MRNMQTEQDKYEEDFQAGKDSRDDEVQDLKDQITDLEIKRGKLQDEREELQDERRATIERIQELWLSV